MPAAVVLSGPAGGGKSQRAAELRAAMGTDTVLADFQNLYAAVSGDVRDPETGKYPLRTAALLPAVQYLKQAAITTAVRNELPLIVTNSDRDEFVRKRILMHVYAGRIPKDSDLVYVVNESRTRPLAEVLSEVSPDVGNPFDIAEEVVDPGEDVVSRRLASGKTGNLSKDCRKAIDRWYGRRGSSYSYWPRRRWRF